MTTNKITEVICGFGHPNVQATHHSTIEFTREADLSKNGDCVLVVSTDKGLIDLDTKFKEALKKPTTQITIKIEADDVSDEIHAQGSQKLVFIDPQEIVIRKSDFTSNRTLAVYADKAARDLSRALVEKLKSSTQPAKITLTVST